MTGWKDPKYFLNRALPMQFRVRLKWRSQLFTAVFPVAFYCGIFFLSYYIWFLIDHCNIIRT